MKAFALPLLACLMLSGCASTRVQLSALPGDAEIAVDGTPMGQGVVKLDVGPEYDFPKAYQITIARPGYTPVEATIANKPDYSAIAGTLIIDALWAYWAFSSANTPNRTMQTTYVTFGMLKLLSMPLTLFNNNRFEKQYEFTLAPEAPVAKP